MQSKKWVLFWRYHSEYLLADPCLKLPTDQKMITIVLSATDKLKKRHILHQSILNHVHLYNTPYRGKDADYDEEYYHFSECNRCTTTELTLPDFLSSVEWDIGKEHNCSLLDLHKDICIECRIKSLIPILGTETISNGELTARSSNTATPLTISLIKQTYIWNPTKYFPD
ncbi:MAG: hypothetical protein Harvfovirus35_17 [Harvfovirus sp.]|uniref:Uncharacterized protein n=1 Tax=Harvfovirus sp. TaxID=2487768 RepID=A0A3G5A2L8_9VIRU|nr:MAG: hypothetical protein Harvfovirus35_17 [Harvfovirus sp.]